MTTRLIALIILMFISVMVTFARSNRVQDKVEELLTTNDWRHEVRQGRIAIESRVLTFCVDGRLRERIFDDTGTHDSYGTWRVEHKDDVEVLVLAGESLRNRGRFALSHSRKELTIDLRMESGGGTTRFRGERRSPDTKCSAPN